MAEVGPTATDGTDGPDGVLRAALAELVLGALPALVRARLDGTAADTVVADALTLLQARGQDDLLVRVTEARPLLGPAPDGARCTVLEVATGDRPLLFSTVLAAVDRAGGTVEHSLHPIVGAGRTDDRLTTVRAPRGDSHDESYIRVELEHVLDAGPGSRTRSVPGSRTSAPWRRPRRRSPRRSRRPRSAWMPPPRGRSGPRPPRSAGGSAGTSW